jgi:histone acetyltransferase MYST4
LIDFSYLLSRVEKIPGTPEKPFSALGKVSYHSYWKSVVTEYIDSHRSSVATVSISDIQATTGMHTEDIALTLFLLGYLRKNEENKYILAVDWNKVDRCMEKIRSSIENSSRVQLNPQLLQWTPPKFSHSYKMKSEDSLLAEKTNSHDQQPGKVNQQTEEVSAKATN